MAIKEIIEVNSWGKQYLALPRGQEPKVWKKP